LNNSSSGFYYIFDFTLVWFGLFLFLFLSYFFVSLTGQEYSGPTLTETCTTREQISTVLNGLLQHLRDARDNEMSHATQVSESYDKYIASLASQIASINDVSAICVANGPTASFYLCRNESKFRVSRNFNVFFSFHFISFHFETLRQADCTTQENSKPFREILVSPVNWRRLIPNFSL
jgi:hypothetical protein